MLDWAETSYLNRFSVVINWKQKETNDESKPFNRNHSNICYDKSRQSYFFNKGDDSPLTPANFLCPWDYNNQNNILSCVIFAIDKSRQSYFFNKGDDSPLTPANFLCPWDYTKGTVRITFFLAKTCLHLINETTAASNLKRTNARWKELKDLDLKRRKLLIK